MNITFLIGNGFDLNAGLRTRYRQFLEFYCSKECQHTYAAGAAETEIERAVMLSTISDFTHAMKRDLPYWSDFEDALGRETVNQPLNQKKTFDLCLADFEIEFNGYLRRELARFDLKASLPEASLHLRDDLVGHMDKLRPRYRRALLDGFGPKLHQDRLYQFISFNYTPVLDQLLGPLHDAPFRDSGSVVHRFGQVIHVHGRIDDGMIMGVNDESQIENRRLAALPEFHSSIVKPVINQEYGSGADTDAEQLIRASDGICCFGTSIGRTDAHWWQMVGEWLLTDKSHQVILFSRGAGLDIRLPQFFHHQDNNLKRHFLSQCFPGDDAARKTAAPRVFAALQTEMFSGVTLREKPSSPAKP